MDDGKTYRIRRFHRDDQHPDHHLIVKTGLTLEEAQAHCNDPATTGRDASGQVEWFDGYDEEH
jgi:hypothetical protein